MIDASHANSQKNHANQISVCREHRASSSPQATARIIGVMVESHLVAGRQDLVPGKPLTYGQSVTDACIGWDDSVEVLETLVESVRKRRLQTANASAK